jgi:hypothetical protein
MPQPSAEKFHTIFFEANTAKYIFSFPPEVDTEHRSRDIEVQRLPRFAATSAVFTQA